MIVGQSGGRRIHLSRQFAEYYTLSDKWSVFEDRIIESPDLLPYCFRSVRFFCATALRLYQRYIQFYKHTALSVPIVTEKAVKKPPQKP